MFRFLRQCEEAAMAPLLDLARQRDGAERRAFLDDLRRDAPTITAMIERALAREAAAMPVAHAPSGASAAAPAASPASDPLRTTGPREVRRDEILGVALRHVAPA